MTKQEKFLMVDKLDSANGIWQLRNGKRFMTVPEPLKGSPFVLDLETNMGLSYSKFFAILQKDGYFTTV